MIAAMRRMFDEWRGASPATVPPMDGVLSPNQAIEEAPAILEVDAPDNLAADGDRLLFSSGKEVLALRLAGNAATVEPFARFDHDVSALALAPDGGVAAGLARGGIVLRGGGHDGTVLPGIGGRAAICPTALAFVDSDTLIVALGSQQNGPDGWRRDLMERNSSGSVWRLHLSTGEAACLGDRLAWPAGLLARQDGDLVVAESWRNRLITLPSGSRPQSVLADIAGYPGRLSKASDGGAWLSVFAPRSQLVEFVLREDDYRRAMLAEVEEAFWIAPSLNPARSFLEPMQFGGLRQLGMLKPWAPTRSYGLIVGLDAGGEPRASFHSRADGRRHGVTSCVEIDGRLVATARGGNAVVAIALEAAR